MVPSSTAVLLLAHLMRSARRGPTQPLMPLLVVPCGPFFNAGPRRRGWVVRSGGRPSGSGLRLRDNIAPTLTVVFCGRLLCVLRSHQPVSPEAMAELASTIVAVVQLRDSDARVTEQAIAGKAWSLRRSGSVGALLLFMNSGAQTANYQDNCVAVDVKLSSTGAIQTTCSKGSENCLSSSGCHLQAAMSSALMAISAATGLPLSGIMSLLSSEIVTDHREPGTAVLYGRKLCVVRRSGGSWPFAVVRRKPNGAWMCYACREAPNSCTHVAAALEAHAAAQAESSDAAGSIRDAGREAFERRGFVRRSRRGGAQSEPRASGETYFKLVRPLVPSENAQAKHAAVLSAASSGTPVVVPAPQECPYCGLHRGAAVVRDGEGEIEFGTGAVKMHIGSWWCAACYRTVTADGLEDGLVMLSQYSAYTEVFLFEVGMALCLNGANIASTHGLRECFHQMSVRHILPRSQMPLRTLRGFRAVVLLYLELVVKGLPHALSTCRRCRRPDGSMRTICFDGLQLGFRVRFALGLLRAAVRLQAIPRASIMAHCVTNSAVAKALGSIMSVATTDHAKVQASSVKNVTALRGMIMAFVVLEGPALVDGVERRFRGAVAHVDGASGGGWDPEVDGGVNPALLRFLRLFFRPTRAKRKLALNIASACSSLRQRVPQALMARVMACIAEESGDGDEDETSEEDTSDSDAEDQDELPHHAEDMEEPALADRGGAAGERRRQGALLRLNKLIPKTADATEKVVGVVRAVTCDPVVVWAPGGNWTAVKEMIEVLGDNPFSLHELRRALAHPSVADLRLLRGAVACLAPILAQRQANRLVLRDLLQALKSTARRYDAFVRDHGAHNGGDVEVSAMDMARAGSETTFHPSQYARVWLDVPPSWERFRSVYGHVADQTRDFLASGQWAPSFPPLRPIPDFLAKEGAHEDMPACNHKLGQGNKFTGRAFVASCMCDHPKCIGVVVLDGSEGQRMPIEVVVQRMRTLPEVIVYDFACATLKTGLSRLPWVALLILFLVDRFHWVKNHTLCSKAMNPDSYESMDGVNTSASEQRNAAARRMQKFLRLMDQKNFILLTVYQQAIGNDVAMHKDTLPRGASTASAAQSAERWTTWYRRTLVDGEQEEGPP